MWHSSVRETTDTLSGGELCVCVRVWKGWAGRRCPENTAHQGQVWLVTAPFQASPARAGRPLQSLMPLGRHSQRGHPTASLLSFLC